MRKRPQAPRVGVALPDDINHGHTQSNRAVLKNGLPNVEKHTIAQIDSVIQAQQGDRRSPFADPYSNIRSRPSADWAYSPTGPTGVNSSAPPSLAVRSG